MIEKRSRRPGPAQQRAAKQLRTVAEPHRFRVQLATAGFAVIGGRYSQIEWFDGHDCAVYANRRPLLFEAAVSRVGFPPLQSGWVKNRHVSVNEG